MKTYDAARLAWLKYHHPTTREEYLDITAHAGAFPPAFPRTVYLEIGQACNLNCTFCSKPTRRHFPHEMDETTLRRVIRECADQGVWYLALHDFNEPLLHLAKLLPAIAYAKACGIPTVATTTNITPLTISVMHDLAQAGLDSLHLSFEGADPALYQRVRGVRAAVIAKRIRQAVAVRNALDLRTATGQRRPWMAITMVRTTETDAQCAAFLAEWGAIVDDVEVRPALEFLGRTQFTGAEVPAQRIPCRYVGDRLIVTAGGLVTTCSVDLDAELALGDVSAGDTLAQIWQSEKYRTLWALHQWGRWDELPEPCKSCGSYDFLATHRSAHARTTQR